MVYSVNTARDKKIHMALAKNLDDNAYEGLQELLKLNTNTTADEDFLDKLKALRKSYPIIESICKRDAGFLGFKAINYAGKSAKKKLSAIKR